MTIWIPNHWPGASAMLSSWMLIPDPNLGGDRKSIIEAFERTKVLTFMKRAGTLVAPQPFIFSQTSSDELTRIPNPRSSDPPSPTKIATADDGDMAVLLGSLLSDERAYQQRDLGRYQLAYRQGFLAGCVLLACYIFDSNQARGHISSQTRGEQAAEGITSLAERTVRTYFRSHKSVAYLWAAYIIQSRSTLFDVIDQTLIDYSKSLVPTNFIFEVDSAAFKKCAIHLAKYAEDKDTAIGRLVEQTLSFDFLENQQVSESISISQDIFAIFLNHYKPGKREQSRPSPSSRK